MKKTFKIYPALFILSPVQSNHLAKEKEPAKAKMIFDSHDIYFINGHPQTYYGECQFNADRTMVSLPFNQRPRPFLFMIELPENIFTKVEPKKYKGEKFTLTYISVNN